MTVSVDCRKAILDRAMELIPAATAEELDKIASAVTILDKEDAVNLMLKYMNNMKAKMEEEDDALIQRNGQ